MHTAYTQCNISPHTTYSHRMHTHMQHTYRQHIPHTAYIPTHNIFTHTIYPPNNMYTNTTYLLTQHIHTHTHQDKFFICHSLTILKKFCSVFISILLTKLPILLIFLMKLRCFFLYVPKIYYFTFHVISVTKRYHMICFSLYILLQKI